MANSYAFVLSKNTYPDAWQAKFLGVNQGTMIVYASTNTLSSSTVLYADSRLTQPIYGNPDLWLGAQLLTDTAVKYAVEIAESGAINPVSNPTTTTTTTTTSTTSTTTSTSTSTTTTTTAAPTTTTTTNALFAITGGYYSSNGSSLCNNPINNFSPLVNAYCTTATLQDGSYLYNGNSTSTPIIGGLYISNVQGQVFLSSYDFPGRLVAFPC